MIEAVANALARVLGHSAPLREDTPLSAFGHWPDIAVLVASAVNEATGIHLTDDDLLQVQTVGDLVDRLESRQG